MTSCRHHSGKAVQGYSPVVAAPQEHFWEKKIKSRGEKQDPRSLFPTELRSSLVHEDIESYARGALLKVRSLISVVLAVLLDAYEQFKDLPRNDAALAELKSNFERYEFEYFA